MNLPFNLLILLSLAACIGAQRAGRINAPAESGADAPTRRSRGRVRFTVPSGVSETDLLDAAAPIERHSEPTVRKADRKLTRPSSKPYEVKEILDDIPNVNARKTHKPRVITETRFEAANAPKKPLYVPLPLPEDEVLPEDIVANFSPQITKYSTEKVEKIAETTVKEITTPIVSISQVGKTEVSTEEILPLTTNLGQSSELTTLGEQQPSTENEIKKIDTTTPDIRKKTLEPLQIVTPVNDARKVSRVPSRSRLASSTEAATRTRTRPIRRQDTQDSSEESLVSTSNIRTRPRTRQQQEKSIDASPARQLRSKPIRRRLDNAETALGGGKTKIPSLFSEEDTQDDTLKTRTGRKVNYASTPENDSVQTEEKKHFQRRRPAHVKDRVTNSIESTTITGDTSNNRDVPRSYRNRNGARSPNRARERTTEAQQVDEAPVPNRRTSIRGRKPSVKYVAIEPVKIEKVPRTRVYNSTEKTTTVKEEESTRSKTKVTTQIESETTTTPPTTKSRRVDHQSRIKPELQSESKIDEKVISTTTQSPSTVENRRSSLRNRIGSRRPTKAPSSSDDTTQSPQATTSRNDVRRRSFSRRVNVVEPAVKEPVKEVNRNNRQRTRYIPPIIDEQKLEVLPLFESEAKTIAPIRARQNFESMNAAASSSEHQIKVGTSNEIKIDSPIRVETKTEKSEHIQHIRTVQPTKQSVETKVSEVVTKRKIGRQVVRKIKVNKTNINNNISGEKSNESNDGERKSVKTVVVPVKGHRRVESSKDNKVSSKLSSSEEDIGDSDNYPEPFKALIQAKLATQSSKKGSRLQQKTASEDRITKSTEKIVTSSRAVSINPSTTTTVRSTTTTTEAPKTTFLKPNDADNELFPHSTATETTRPTRRRFSLTTTTKVPEIPEDVSTKYVKRPLYLIRKVARSTVAPSEVSVITEVSAKVKKQPRYHARFSASVRNEERVIEKSANSLQNQDGSLKKDQEVVSATPKVRSYSPKPPRGLYSTRKGGKKRTAKQESSVSAQVTNEGKKSGRYSARYRSDIFSRAGSTRPTSAPAYIPTVPTVTTPSVSAPVGIEDNISGMEVISIDDPVNTIPSDSLINGELLSNPNPPFSNHPPTKLIPASLVTKDGPATVTKATPPVSIIERIIYSITAISTATPDLNVDLTNDGPTKSSAILKIPSKTTKEDVTFNVLSQHKLQPETVTTNEIIRPLTTERPTTIIERILSSISAIQASSTTERTQVGNILSSVSTNPLPQNLRGVTASVSSTTISTLSSSSATPLGPALDEIEELSSEQAEQQRTISKLLALLKSITPNTSSTEDVVVVTPKSKASSTPDISIDNDVEVFNISSNLNPAIPERSSTEAPATDTTTPDVAQNTIAQNTFATESSTSEPNPTVNLNSRLLGPVSISDFIATLDSLNNIEATTPINANAIIESTTTSSTIESGTAIPSSTIEAVTTTLVETANLVTEATSSVNPAAESSTESANLDSNATIEVEQKSANVESTTPALLERLAVDTQEANAVTPTNGATTDVEQNVENSTPATSEQGSSSTEANAVTSTSGATPGVEQTSVNVENSTPALLERLAVDTQEGATTETNAATSTTGASTGVEQTPASVENSTPTVSEAVSTAANAVTSTSGATTGVEQNSANVENSTPALLERLAVDTQEGATTEANAATSTTGVEQTPASVENSTPTVTEGTSTAVNAVTSTNDATPGVEQSSANVENTTPAVLERLAVDTQDGATTEASAPTLTSGATTGVEQNSANVENSTPALLERLAVDTQAGATIEANAATSTTGASTGVEQTPASVENSIPTVSEGVSTAANVVTFTSVATILDAGVEQTPANVETSTPAVLERLAVATTTETNAATSTNGAANLDTTATPGVEQNVDQGSGSTEANAAIQNSTGADVTTEGANVETSTPAISERLADSAGAQNIETTPEQTITTEAPSTTTADKTSSTPNPTTILAMLTRLLELADRAQTLTTLTLEQTTVSTIPESPNVNDGTTALPTLTTLGNFEVSPGSVTVFSANDVSSMSNLSVDDGTTITISSRSFLTTSAPSTEASITQTIPPTNNIITTLVPSISDGNLETSVNSISSSSDNPITSTVPSGDLIASTIAPADVVATTVVPQDLTTIPAETETMPSDVTTIEPSSINNNDSSTSMSTSTVTNVIITTQENASNVTVSERAGRVLALPEEVVRNDIQTSSEPPEKDFYVFGILPNNTILRKRPSMYPNKRTPFIIVGVYPNNTVIQKFPNGTQIPPEPVIQVSGFDTRDNPPPLPEITSNQVTQDSSVPQDDNKNLQTAVASRVAEAGQPETTAAPSTLPPETTTAAPVVTTTSPPITTTTAAPVVTTTSPPPIATTSPSVAESGGQPTTTVKDAKNGDGTKDVEEINIEENTISNNNGNTKAEKIVEKPTTTQAALPQTTVTTPAPTTTAKPQIVATTQPTNQQITESAAQPTTILAAIRIDDLEDVETTLPAIDMTTVVPDIANRFGTNPPTTLRYTNTATTVIPPSEALQLTIRPTTPYLIQRIIGNVTGIPVRIGGLTTETPISTIPTEIPTTRFSVRSRFITTIPRAMTAPTTVEAPTTEIPTTIRNRGRSRYTLFVPNDSRTVTVTPSTISTQQPGFDDYPIRTTYTPRRFTQTPATITVPSKIATSTPTNIPTATEQYFLSTTSLGLQNAPSESSTVFPIYTSAFDFTTETPAGITQQEATTNTLPTFASTFRPRQRTTTSFATTREDLEKLVELRVRNNFGELSTGGDFYNPTTVSSQISSTTAAAALQTSLRSVNSKVKQLTEQQIKDLEELARLEKEQAAILQQLAFLTRLAGTPKPTRSNSNNNLAGRVLDFAANRNKQSTTQKPPNLLEALTNQNPKQVESKSPSLEEILKQFNVNPNAVTVSSLTSTYGKSTDAILAALLKERGIEPSTPKTLGELDELRTTIPTTTTRKATTTRRRITTTTTARPGPIMQGLNWLLNALAPAPTTKKPQTRKVASTPKNVELISSQPTEITQVAVTAPPRTRSVSTAKRGSSRYRKPLHSLSESELKNLVGQLEAAQKDPSKAKEIDFSALGYPADSSSKPTNLLSKNAVQITNSGNIGTTSKIRAVADSSTKQAAVVPLVFNRGRSTTAVPAVVSNSIADDVDEETTTAKQRRLPPVQLNPVPGIDGEDGTQVRGQLINAAVNVTRAISQFLGSAIQDAAFQITHLFANGTNTGNAQNQISPLAMFREALSNATANIS